MINILFICHGNICRSPMAEFIIKDLVEKAGLSAHFHIASAATSREEIGNDIHYGTKAKLKKMQIPFQKRGALQVTKADYEFYDYLIIMDDNNARNLKRLLGEDLEGKVYKAMSFLDHTREVKDPWYTGNFEETYEDLSKACAALLQKLRQKYQL